MAKNGSFTRAQQAKEDEFYTKLTDIKKELKHYKSQLKDKVIFCNCDDPEYSNFWKYFQLNFYQLGLKKLISTHYEIDKPSYKLEIVANNSNDEGEQFTLPDYVQTPLEQNGDFRSPECIRLLEEADVVVTNPPFSLFPEYVAQLVKYKKKFLIIGNLNAITYKDIFPLLKANKIWLGYEHPVEFITPDKKTKKVLARWYTNLDIQKRHEDIILYKSYNSTDYPKYDNYNAIEVKYVKNIPQNYNDIMGVPISFMDAYNPEQFEIIGTDEAEGVGLSGDLFISGSTTKQCMIEEKKDI